MPLLETWTGEERAFGKTAKLHVMYVPEQGSPERETHLNVAAKNGKLTEMRKPQRHDAYPGKIDDFGHWYEAVYQTPEGLVLRVKGHRSAGHGQRAGIASIYIQMRSGAAMRSIDFHATDGAGRRQPTYSISGRFDIMTPDEVRMYAGAIPHWVLPEINEAAVQRTFVVRETQPELHAKAKVIVTEVVTASGSLRQVVVRERNRKITL